MGILNCLSLEISFSLIEQTTQLYFQKILLDTTNSVGTFLKVASPMVPFARLKMVVAMFISSYTYFKIGENYFFFQIYSNNSLMEFSNFFFDSPNRQDLLKTSELLNNIGYVWKYSNW